LALEKRKLPDVSKVPGNNRGAGNFMSALGLLLVVALVLLVVAFSPKVAAWFGRDASRESLRAELEALERKKEILRQMQTPVATEQAKRPPAA
jgi:hypothetical protein